MTEIPALTLYQVWASLIEWGEKEIETRSFRPNLEIGSPLGIHAGRTLDSMCLTHPEFIAACARHGTTPDKVPRGYMLCVVQLQAVIRTEDLAGTLSNKEFAFGNFAPGRWGWKLKVYHVFNEPIPVRGQMGIWKWKIPEGITLNPAPPIAKQMRMF